jgi:hypothetical protein
VAAMPVSASRPRSRCSGLSAKALASKLSSITPPLCRAHPGNVRGASSRPSTS